MLPPLSVRTGLLLCAALGCLAFPLEAQTITPVGGEQSVFGGRSGEQLWPALVTSSSGGLLLWEDSRIEYGTDTGIAGALLDGSGAVSGQPFRVNAGAAGSQEKPSVARLADGRFLAVWETRLGGKAGVFGRVVAADGSMNAAEFQVSPSTSHASTKITTNWPGIFRNRAQNRKYKFLQKITQIREHSGAASVAALPNGGAVIAYQSVRRWHTNTWGLLRQTSWNGWKSKTNDVLRPVTLMGDAMQEVFLRLVDASGQLTGSEILVNAYAPYNQRTPSVAVLGNGNLVVAWVSEQPRSQIFRDNFVVRLIGRVFDPAGSPLSDEFVISVSDTVANANPLVAASADGGFIVLWSQRDPAGETQWDVYSRRFNADGAPLGVAALVNERTVGDQFGPKIAAAGSQHLTVWTSVGQDGSREGVYGRLLTDGVPAGSEFRINTTTVSRQMYPAVASRGGQFLAVWASFAGETAFDLFSQHYSLPQTP